MRLAILPLLIFALTGCAAAVIGYTPDSGSRPKPSALQPFNGGSMSQSGRYVVSDEERELSCGKLTGSMHVIKSRLKDSANRPRPGMVAETMQAATKPFLGKGANLDVDDEIKQARARLVAYNELLAEKTCKTLDISGV